MAKLPWFQFESTAWLSDPRVRLMSSRQRGWYIDLLCWCWQEGGVNRDDASYLCRLRDDLNDAYSGDDSTVIRGEFEEVLSHFQDMEDGRISHPKLESFRSQALEKMERQSLAGKSTQAKLAAKQIANLQLRASNSKSLSKSVSEKEEKDEIEMTPAFDEQFQNFKALYESVGNPIEEDFANGSFCWRAWCLLDYEQRSVVVASLRDRQAAGVSVLHKPDNYLTKNEWKRKLRVNGTGRLTRDEQLAQALREA